MAKTVVAGRYFWRRVLGLCLLYVVFFPELAIGDARRVVLEAAVGETFEAGKQAYDRGDYAAAYRQWLPLATQGNGEAQYYLGWMHSQGQVAGGTDRAEAVAWYRRAAEQGHAKAQVELGLAYSVGGTSNFAESVKWYRRAAEQGNVQGQFFLGKAYYWGDEGMWKDLREAAKWFRRAAEQGNGEAQYYLGWMYSQGQVAGGTDRAEAVAWYRRAAEQGNVQGQFVLGKAYYWGDEGIRKDPSEAAKWFRRAAEQGNHNSESFLGEMYRLGRGVRQDFLEAMKWYRKAADRGDSSAQNELGLMYEFDVQTNLVLAHMWYNLAATNATGRQRARVVENRDRVASLLTPAELARAQRMARDWMPGETAPGTSTSPPTAPPLSPSKGTLEIASTGTGFVVSKHGDVLTNAHVVTGCREVRTRVPSATSRLTPVTATDAGNDLALLRLALAPSSAGAFRDGRGVRQGDGIVAVGFPLQGLLASGANVTAGTISALAGLGDDSRYLQITAPVQPGNSGGPLLDQSGNVVGVVVGKLDALRVAEALGDIPQNVNFAINAAVVRSFLEANGVEYQSARSTGLVQTADIGDRAKRFTLVVECWR